MKNLLVYTALALTLAACGSKGSGGSAAPDKTPTIPVIVPPPIIPPAPVTQALTYYTIAQTLAVTTGGQSHAFTVTGHCVSYQTNDYCWDDGWQIPAGLTSTDEQSFWGLCDQGGGSVTMCSGGTTTDPVVTPKLWSSMVGLMTTPLHFANDVYTSGIPTNVTCTVNGSVIDCVDFQIDTSNATL